MLSVCNEWLLEFGNTQNILKRPVCLKWLLLAYIRKIQPLKGLGQWFLIPIPSVFFYRAS